MFILTKLRITYKIHTKVTIKFPHIRTNIPTIATTHTFS